MRLGDASEADMSAERPVLVVDDDPAVATLVATVLRRHALAVEIALDAPAALGRLRTTRYGAVLTDMTMPSMSGLELVRAARAADPQAPPFLVMTAYLDPATDARLRAQPGIVSIMRKPFEMERLVALVRAALDQPAPERAAVIPAVSDEAAVVSISTALLPRIVVDRAAGSLRLAALRAAAERRAREALARARARAAAASAAASAAAGTSAPGRAAQAEC
jgi:DNA-binding response OmpR family regulator